jgi:hypothetical protein
MTTHGGRGITPRPPAGMSCEQAGRIIQTVLDLLDGESGARELSGLQVVQILEAAAAPGPGPRCPR